MKTQLPSRPSSPRAAFSMIEMIGVLSVMGILASLIVPKIFESISNAKINAAISNYNTVKTALIEHYTKYGSFANTNGVVITVTGTMTNYDNALLCEGLLEKKFECKLGSKSWIQMRGLAPATPGPSGVNAAYVLSGVSATAAPATNEACVGICVVECVINDVPVQEAITFNDRIDGPDDNTMPDITAADLIGRVKYAAPVGGVTSLYIYIAHR